MSKLHLIRFKVCGYRGDLDELMLKIAEKYEQASGMCAKVGCTAGSNSKLARLTIDSTEPIVRYILKGILEDVIPSELCCILGDNSTIDIKE